MTVALGSPTVANTVAADLLLARMSLASKKAVSPTMVRRDISKLLDSELTAGQFDELRSELTSAGLLSKGKRNTFAVTEAGRERALRFLGIAELEPSANWSSVIARFLFPKAAGLSAEAAAKLNSGDKLATFVLKRKYGLDAKSGPSVRKAAEAVVCKELGFADETTLDDLMCAVLSKLMGADRLTKAKLVKQLPLFDTGLTATSADAVRRKIVQDWLAGMSAPAQPPELKRQQFDLPAFAAAVRALAASSPPEDRFHENKVFVAALWRTSQRDPNFQRLSLPEFKRRLIEANLQNLLHLSRADLVKAMDSQLVADSETVYLNATFHFVLLEGDRP